MMGTISSEQSCKHTSVRAAKVMCIATLSKTVIALMSKCCSYVLYNILHIFFSFVGAKVLIFCKNHHLLHSYYQFEHKITT